MISSSTSPKAYGVPLSGMHPKIVQVERIDKADAISSFIAEFSNPIVTSDDQDLSKLELILLDFNSEAY